MLIRVPMIVLGILCAVVAALAAYTAYDVRLIGQASPAKGRFIDVSGGRLHLVETGDRDKYPVVLLHGASVNLGDMMLALSGELSAYRVIAVDRPGHGWSDRPGGRADASPKRPSASHSSGAGPDRREPSDIGRALLERRARHGVRAREPGTMLRVSFCWRPWSIRGRPIRLLGTITSHWQLCSRLRAWGPDRLAVHCLPIRWRFHSARC